MSRGMTPGQALRFAARDLRGQLGQFRVLILCLALGVGSIATVGFVADSLTAAMDRNAQGILGGDIQLRLVHRQMTDDESSAADNLGQVSEVANLRTMARTPAKQRLVELKAVDHLYPLAGEITLGNHIALRTLNQPAPVAVVDRSLLLELGLTTGQMLSIGQTEFEIISTIVREPDRVVTGFSIGPRVMIHKRHLESTGLVQPGSLISYSYRLLLSEPGTHATVLEQLNADFPDAGWQTRTIDNASDGLTAFVNRLRLFLTLVGIAALLVGGIGIANGVTAYLNRKLPTLALLKALGASRRLVRSIYLGQVIAVTVLASLAGLLLGGLTTFIALPILSGLVNVSVPAVLLPETGLLALLFGLLTSLTFALLPLHRAGEVAPGQLLKNALHLTGGLRPTIGFVLSTATLILLAVSTAYSPVVAAWFIAGAVTSLIILALVGQLIRIGAGWLPRSRRPALRLAIANLSRPGAATMSVVVSLGLGLTLLVAIAQTQGNLTRQIDENLPDQIPSFFVLDIDPADADNFIADAEALPAVSEVVSVPMMRGRITAMKGIPVEDWDIPGEISWIFDGNESRGVTWMRDKPGNADLTLGGWWPADYSGETLVSLDADLNTALGLQIGDLITVNLLGRDFEARIANFRTIDWQSMQINFVMVFSPGLLENAPQMRLATIELGEGRTSADEDTVMATLVNRYTGITMIRVSDAIGQARELLASLAFAITSIAGVTLVTGMVVLAGALSAGREQRIYDNVVLKVLGGTRKLTLTVLLLEYSLLGLIAAAVALIIGSGAAWLLITEILELPFTLLPGVIFGTAATALAVTLLFGLAGTWIVLGAKAAPYLRND